MPCAGFAGVEDQLAGDAEQGARFACGVLIEHALEHLLAFRTGRLQVDVQPADQPGRRQRVAADSLAVGAVPVGRVANADLAERR